MPLGSTRTPPMRTRQLSVAQVADGLSFARNWRIATKPHFDAIYGPERAAMKIARCPTCGARAAVPA